MRRVLLAALPLALAVTCLPKDTRPRPTEIRVTATGSELTRHGIGATSDGYAIHFGRLLVNLGAARVGGPDVPDACDEYSNPSYTRLLDFTQVEAPAELGLSYARGRCAFGFLVRAPNADSKLGTGASAADRTFMRTPGSDPIARNAGISLYVEGVATRGDETKRFAWALREHIRYSQCLVFRDGEALDGLDLDGASTLDVNLDVQGEALFTPPSYLSPGGPIRVGGPGDPSAGGSAGALAEGGAAGSETWAPSVPWPPVFEPYALADADGDGTITLAELFDAPLAGDVSAALHVPAGALGPDATTDFDCFTNDGQHVALNTLGDYLYCVLLPHVVRYETDGFCTTTERVPTE